MTTLKDIGEGLLDCWVRRYGREDRSEQRALSPSCQQPRPQCPSAHPQRYDLESFSKPSMGSSLRASSSSIKGMPSRTGKASRSARHTNTCCDFEYCNGPLQIGQARISSSLVSMGGKLAVFAMGLKHAVEQGRHPCRIGFAEMSLHRHGPMALIGDITAFHGIFFRHQHWRAVRKPDVFASESSMVG